MAATMYAVADPEDEPRKSLNSMVTIAEAMEEYNKAIALNPHWSIPGIGWGPVVIDKEDKKCQQQ